MLISGRYKTSAHAATTATFVEEDGQNTSGDLGSEMTGLVATFATARDTNMFKVVGQKYRITIELL